MFWFMLLVFALGTVAMELIRPKPNFENARPAGLGDFTFPTATEGRAVPVIWGKVKVTGPNLIWYGNLRTVVIKEKVMTGMFSSTETTKGYKYYIGMHFGVCRGPNVKWHNFLVNEKNALSYPSGILPGDSGYGGTVNNENLLGGQERGSGGMAGAFYMYAGSKTQNVDTYIATKQSPDIAYRGTAHGVWQGGWIGNSTSIPPYAFVVSRLPDGLNLAVVNPGAEEPYSGGCNPMNVIYEILTDTDWGLHISTSDIDLTNFRDAADTLYQEGNGFAMAVDNPKKVEDILNELQRQINGTLYFDRTNALWRVKLVRDDYDPGTIPEFDESNTVELVDYTRQTWEETTNQVRVKYADNTKNWQQTYALAQDIANISIQATSVAADVSYPGCQNATLANNLAWRDLKVLAFPLGKINVKFNREAFHLIVGSVFKYSNLRLGISGVVWRVQEINPGNIDSQEVTVAAVQDVFAAGVGTFSPPITSGWTGAVEPAVAPITGDTLVVEAPRQMVIQSTIYPDLQPRAWMGARWPGGGTINFQVWSRVATARPIGGAFAEDGATINGFLLKGKLNSAIDAYGSSASRPDNSYFIDIDEDPDTLTGLVVRGNEGLISGLLNIVYIDGEYIGYLNLSDLGGGAVRLSGLYRGLFHTAPKAHAIDAPVWFIGQGGNISEVVFPTTAYDEADFQLRSQDEEEVMAEGDTPIEQLSLDYIWFCPLAPRDPLLNGSYAPASTSLDTSYTGAPPSGTGLTGDDARALKVQVTPRAWRVDEVLEDTDLSQSSPSYLGDSPSFEFVLVLDPGGTPTVLDAVTVSGTEAETPIAYILRNAVIAAVGANATIPSTGRIRVTAKHTYEAVVRTNPLDMEFDVTVTSALQNDDLLHGGLTVNVAGDAVIYGETGTYNFDIHTALPASGILEANVNGGGYTTVVAAASSTGTLAITAGDSVVLRFTQAPANDQFFDVTGPTAEVGHGVLLA